MKRIHFLAVFLFGLVLASIFPTTRPILDAVAQNIACYRAQGGASNVAASGCTYSFESGSTLSIASGSTVILGAALTTGNVPAVIGDATTDSVTITTDGTGTAEVVLPAGSVSGTEISDASLLPADDTYPGRGYFEICGDITTINNNTVYYGPSQAVNDSATVGGVVCDTNAAGNVTEATADEPVLTADAILPLGMVCYSTDMGATGSPMTFTLRSAEADITPTITLQIADNELSSAVNTAATTAIASGATVAVAVSSSGDVGAGAFYCRIPYAF